MSLYDSYFIRSLIRSMVNGAGVEPLLKKQNIYS
jgi:hypothetical protein